MQLNHEGTFGKFDKLNKSFSNALDPVISAFVDRLVHGKHSLHAIICSM